VRPFCRFLGGGGAGAGARGLGRGGLSAGPGWDRIFLGVQAQFFLNLTID
jgi:hypothetical protein